MKEKIVERAVRILERKKFSCLILKESFFDIIAKNGKTFVIKAIFNIDSLNFYQAANLKTFCHFISAYPLIVSEKNNREFLEKAFYFRYGIPVTNLSLLEDILEDKAFYIFSKKGKKVVEIDNIKLKKIRKEKNISLSKLSSMTNISKKTLYQIERGKNLPTLETIEKLENALKINCKSYFKPLKPKPIYLRPKTRFEKSILNYFEKLKIEKSSLYSNTLNFIFKFTYVSMAKIYENIKDLKQVERIKKISSFTFSKPLIICKYFEKRFVKGVPVLTEKDVKSIESLEDINKKIENFK